MNLNHNEAVFLMSELPKKIQQLLGFLNDDPNDAFTLFALAQEYQKINETKKSEDYYLKLVRIHANYVGTYYHLGRLYENLNRKQDAVDVYKKGIAIATKQNDLHARAELQSVLLEAEGLGDDDF